MSAFPQAVAALDGCHIRIKAPTYIVEDYVNRKESHSIFLQGLVDNKYLFQDIFVGQSGMMPEFSEFLCNTKNVYKDHFCLTHYHGL